MQIIKDPNNPEVGWEEKKDENKRTSVKIGAELFLLCCLTFALLCQALDSDQGSNESDTEQRNKALRGRM